MITVRVPSHRPRVEVESPSQTPTPLIRLAAIALAIAGTSYLALMAILVIVSGGELPMSGRELLDYLARYGAIVQVAMAIFVVKDACILLAFPILARLLGGLQKPTLWVATVLALLGMILDIASGLVVIAFRGFAQQYAAASPPEQGDYLPAADLVFRYVWQIETPFIAGLLSLAVLLFSLSMTRHKFGGLVPWVGEALGLVGIIGAALALIQPILLLSVWYIAVAFKLFRVARSQERRERQSIGGAAR